MTKKVAKKKTSKKKTAKKGGRPSPYKKEFANIAKFLCDMGATDEEIGECLGVSERTINRWKKNKPEFCQSLKKGKEYYDNKIEVSLAKRAIGYSHPGVHISNYQGKITVTPITKHYAPEVTACIYWLNNRQSQNWASRKAVDAEKQSSASSGGVIEMPAPASIADWEKMGTEAMERITKAHKDV